MRRSGPCRAADGLAGTIKHAMRRVPHAVGGSRCFRRAQGKKHTVACTLTVHVLAKLANMKGCLAAVQFARAVGGEPGAVGAWRNPRTGLREPVSKPTLHWAVQSVDPRRWRRWSAAGPGSGLPSPGRSPPTASASGAPTATDARRPRWGQCRAAPAPLPVRRCRCV